VEGQSSSGIAMKTLFLVLALACLTIPSIAATRTWNGAVSNSWSNPVNWSEGTAPANGDDLVFPREATSIISINDLPAGLLLHSITVNWNNYKISGNAIVLGAGGFVENNEFLVSLMSGTLNFSSVTLSVPQTWTGAEHAERMMVGPTNINGQTLMITGGNFTIASMSGSGSVIERLSGLFAETATTGSIWTGSLTVDEGTFSLNGTSGDAVVNGGTLELFGGASGNVVINSGGMLDVRNAYSIGSSRSGSIEVVPARGAPATIRIEMSDFNGVADNVTGSVALNNALLTLNTSGPPPGGATLTIFNNDGTDPVIGTFLGLPEGAIINNGSSAQLSYKGGTGNDVTLTTLHGFIDGTTTTLATSTNPSAPGDPVTLTATVTTSSGNVEFYDGSVLLGTVPLDASGRAVLAVPFVSGTHTITAAYTGTTSFATSQASVVQQVIPSRRHATRR